MDFIEKLQQKPTREKRRIAFIFSVAITAIVFLFWLSFFSTFHSDSFSSNTTGNNASFSVLKDNTRRVYEIGKNQWERIREFIWSNNSIQKQ